MKKNIYIHAGPYKTGSTAIQAWLYTNRRVLESQGWLYPTSGIVTSSESLRYAGPRHYHLFRDDEPSADWERLLDEIEHSGCMNTLLSAERICANPEMIIYRQKYLERFNPKLVITVRNQAAMVKSMYLQVIKSRFRRGLSVKEKPYTSAAAYFQFKKDSFSYARIIAPWSKLFGIDSVIFVPYAGLGSTSVIDSLASRLGLITENTVMSSERKNKSITPLESSLIHLSQMILDAPSKQKRFVAKSLGCLRWAPGLERSWPLVGFNEKAISSYYKEENSKLISSSQDFRDAYRATL